MNKSERKSANKILRRGAIGLGLAATSIFLTACSNPEQTASETSANHIKPCPTDSRVLPGASDGRPVTRPYSTLTRLIEKEAKIIYERVEANGGNITLNSNLGTEVSYRDHRLVMKADDAALYLPGYQVDIAVESSDPVIGLGALVCNTDRGGIVQTNFSGTVSYFYSHTSQFPSASTVK